MRREDDQAPSGRRHDGRRGDSVGDEATTARRRPRYAVIARLALPLAAASLAAFLLGLVACGAIPGK